MNRTKAKVIEKHIPLADVKLVLQVNEIVKAGEEYTGNPDWPGWIKCINNSGVDGWVPERILKIEQGNARVLEDYDSTELSVEPEEVLSLLSLEGGWALCSKTDGSVGWVPEKNLEQLMGE